MQLGLFHPWNHFHEHRSIYSPSKGRPVVHNPWSNWRRKCLKNHCFSCCGMRHSGSQGTSSASFGWVQWCSVSITIYYVCPFAAFASISDQSQWLSQAHHTTQVCQQSWQLLWLIIHGIESLIIHDDPRHFHTQDILILFQLCHSRRSKPFRCTCHWSGDGLQNLKASTSMHQMYATNMKGFLEKLQCN